MISPCSPRSFFPSRVEDLAVAVGLGVEGQRTIERAVGARAVDVGAVGDQEEADVARVDVRLIDLDGRGRAGGDAGVRAVVVRADEDDAGFAGAAVVPAEAVVVAGTFGNERDLQRGHLNPPGLAFHLAHAERRVSQRRGFWDRVRRPTILREKF